MAVVFEPRQPVVPDISAAYGRAEGILRGNAPLADAYQDAARLQTQVAESRADRAFRGQQATLERGQQAAGQGVAAMGRLAGINAETQQREFERQDDRNNLVMQMQARAGAQQQEMAGRADLMKLESFLSQQAMTNRDVAELNNKKRLLAEILADDNLAPEEQRAIGMQLMTGARGINTLETRAQFTRQKAMEQEQQALAKQQQLFTTLQTGDQAAKTEALAKIAVPIRNPYTGQDELFYATPAGELKPLPMQGKANDSGQAKMIEMDADLAIKEADLAAKEADVVAKGTLNGTTVDTSVFKEARASIRAIRQGLRGGQGQGQGQQQPGGQPPAEAFKPGEQANWPGFDPRNPPPGEPANLVRNTLTEQAAVNAMPGVAPEAKQAYIAGLGQLMNLIAKKDKTDADRKQIEEMGRTLRRPEPPPATPSPQRRPIHPGSFF